MKRKIVIRSIIKATIITILLVIVTSSIIWGFIYLVDTFGGEPVFGAAAFLGVVGFIWACIYDFIYDEEYLKETNNNGKKEEKRP